MTQAQGNSDSGDASSVNLGRFEGGVKVAQASCEWMLENFSEIKDNSNLLAAQKLQLEIAGRNGVTYKWEISLCHRTTNFADIGFNLLLLSSTSNNPSVFIRCTLKTRTVSGRVVQGVVQVMQALRNYPGTFLSYQEKNDLPLNPLITVNLLVFSVVPGRYNPQAALTAFQVNSREKLSQFLGSLEGSHETADVSIVSKDKVKSPAHRLILSQASPVFDVMLRTEMKEKIGGVIKTDLSGKCVKILLHLFYTGTLENGWKDADVLPELIYAADKYQLEDLWNFLDEAVPNICAAKDAPGLLGWVTKFSMKKAEIGLLALVKNSVSTTKDLMEVVNTLQNH